jgi:hypothetical protein
MSRVLVVANGKPYYVTEAKATELVGERKAVWQKPGRRIKYIAGKRSRPQVHDLSCSVDADLIVALRNRNSQNHDLARVFVNQMKRNRERVKKAA